jgi:exopolysaccharide biosynthesis polyprenyl glycosylphosphotransferase
MTHRNSENYAIFSMMMDATWILFSLAFITTIRPALSYFSFFAVIPPPYNLPWILYIIFPLIWVGILTILAAYDTERNPSINNVLAIVTLSSFISGVFLAGVLYLTYRDTSRFLFLLFFLMATGGLIFWRLIAQMIIARTRTIAKTAKILVVGDNDITRELASNLHSSARTVEIMTANYPQDEAVTRIIEKVSVEEFQEIIISITGVVRPVVNELVGKLHRLPVKVWVIPDYFQLTLHKAVFSEYGGMPLLDLRTPALSYDQRVVKRAFDLVIVLMLLPAVIPLMLILAILVRFDSPGPILLRQRRVGENGAIFPMYKFRTMVSNAESLRPLVESYKDGQLIHKQSNDPRVTRLGKFLRRWSLDEVPQVFNVLKGEMSLVGPRPELPYLVDRYETWQLIRFSVPQGITGWWQVNGRSEKPMHLNTADDVYYVQNYSILLDAYILLKTIGVVFHGKGAF